METEADSERIAAYLADRATDDDEMLVVNVLDEGADTTEDVQAGEQAVGSLKAALADLNVETHQLIRNRNPADELLSFATDQDADEIAIGVHERNPTGKAIFGSTAQGVERVNPGRLDVAPRLAARSSSSEPSPGPRVRAVRSAGSSPSRSGAGRRRTRFRADTGTSPAGS